MVLNNGIPPPADGLGLKEGVERPSRVAAWFFTKVRGLRAPPRRLRNVGIHSARSGLSGSRLGIAARPLYAACRRNTAAGSIPHSRRQPVERLLRWDGVNILLYAGSAPVKEKSHSHWIALELHNAGAVIISATEPFIVSHVSLLLSPIPRAIVPF